MIGGGKDFLTGKNVTTLLTGTVSGLDSTSKTAFNGNSRFINNLSNRSNAFLKGLSFTHRTPRADTTPVDRPDLAHDIISSAEVERVGTEVIVLDKPLGAVSENRGHVLEIVVSVFALDVHLGDRGA